MNQFSVQRIDQGEVQVVSLCGYMGNDEFYRVEKELVRLLEQEQAKLITLERAEAFLAYGCPKGAQSSSSEQAGALRHQIPQQMLAIKEGFR